MKKQRRKKRNREPTVRTNTTADPFRDVLKEVHELLKRDFGLQATTILKWLQQVHPDKFHDGQLRSLQRRVREWRVLYGPDQEVIFQQDIRSGRQSQSDYTWCNELEVTIRGEPFPHLLYHFILTYSRWEYVCLVNSESFQSLTDGYRKAVRKLGLTAPEHRTDNLLAAVPLNGNLRFQKRWCDFLSWYNVKPSANNPGQSHENGSIEKSNNDLKVALDQRLRLRGTRDFCTREAYLDFVDEIVSSRNSQRRIRVMEEKKLLQLLPATDWASPQEMYCQVSGWSTIAVFGAVYSVPSRLIGSQVRVQAWPETIQLYLNDKVLEEMPRVPSGERCLNYRHLISHLMRVPERFSKYQFREDLFPTLWFRKAYDLLHKRRANGDLEYLKLLQLAAFNGEQDVNVAIELLMGENELPTHIAVRELIERERTVPEVLVLEPNLAQYDALLGS